MDAGGLAAISRLAPVVLQILHDRETEGSRATLGAACLLYWVTDLAVIVHVDLDVKWRWMQVLVPRVM